MELFHWLTHPHRPTTVHMPCPACKTLNSIRWARAGSKTTMQSIQEYLHAWLRCIKANDIGLAGTGFKSIEGIILQYLYSELGLGSFSTLWSYFTGQLTPIDPQLCTCPVLHVKH